MKKTLRVMIAAALALTLTAAVSGCRANTGNKKSESSAASAASSASSSAASDSFDDRMFTGEGSKNAESSEKTESSDESKSESSQESKDESKEESREESREESKDESSTEDPEVSSVVDIPDEFSEEEAEKALLAFLGGDKRLSAIYMNSVTVTQDGEYTDYYCFDVRLSNEETSSHVDYYYIIKSRFGGGIYDSESFRKEFDTELTDAEETNKEAVDQGIIKTEDFTVEAAKNALLKYLGDNEKLDAVYFDTVTIRNDEKNIEYYRFDVRYKDGAKDKRLDFCYVAKERFGNSIYDSKGFAAMYGVVDENFRDIWELIDLADFTADDAKQALLKYLGGDERLYAEYTETVTVNDHDDDTDYYRFDVRIDNDSVSTHIDYYYVIKSRFGGGIYDSAAFGERFGVSRDGDYTFSDKPDTDSEVIETKKLSSEAAAKVLLQYFNGAENLSVHYLDAVTVDDNGEDMDYYRFDVRLNHDGTSSHADYFYVSRTGHAIYDSQSFSELFHIS